MNQTQQTVLSIIGSALFAKEPTIAPDTDWQEVQREMLLHGVVFIGMDNLSELPGIAPSLIESWSNAGFGAMKRFYRVLREQAAITSLLGSTNVQSVVLKGAAAAMYYPNPDYRIMGDIDLLIERGRTDDAVGLMTQNGYTHASAGSCSRHESMRRGDLEIELHRFFSAHTDNAASQYLNDLLLDAIPRAETHTLQGVAFRTLPPLENGLVLLEHLNHHLSEGIGLRHVLDWAMYASNILTDEFWHASFQQQAQRIGLETLAIVTTRVAQLYLGMPTENHTWCMDADEEACRALIEYVLSCGNFGVKHGQTKQVKRISTGFVSIGEMFRRLQADGCLNFSRQIKRFPILKPFAWLMRIVRLVYLSIRKGLRLKDLRSSFAESRERITLFRQLGLDNPDKKP